jgi:DNA-binding HxlR family transcriptional regulator
MKIMKKLPEQPVERALRVIAGRWKIAILCQLLAGPRRQSELMRLIPGITQKVLIQQLRELESHDLVVRTVFPVMPPKVEYSLTEHARSFAPIADALCTWRRQHEAESGRTST